MNKVNDLITDFIEYCEVDRGLSPSTARKYDYRLSRFLGWAQNYLGRKELKLSDLDQKLIRKFRQYLSRRELKDATRYNYVVTIRSFLKFLSKHNYKSLPPEKVELSRYNPGRSIKFLKPEQLELLLKAPDTSKVLGVRDRAILELLFSTGLRVSELAGLDRKKIDLKRQEFNVVGKGGRRRVVFISRSAAVWLRKYLHKRIDNYVPLFLHYSGPLRLVDTRSGQAQASQGEIPAGSKGARKDASKFKDPRHPKVPKIEKNSDLDDLDGERFRLSVRSIQRLVKKYVRQAGLNVEATPHTLRHSLATDLLSAGADLRSIQEILGHKNVSTTQIYTHLTNVQLKETHKKFHGKWRK